MNVTPAGTLSTGQVFQLVETVQNNGQGTALSVTASGLNPVGPGVAGLLTSPLPVSGVASLLAGNSTAFTYTFQATGAGLVSLSGTANGFNTLGSPIGSVLNGTSPISIQNAVQLTADAISLSNTVSVGQQFGCW